MAGPRRSRQCTAAACLLPRASRYPVPPGRRPGSMNSRAVLSPTQLNALARDLLEGAFPLVWVQGELSGVSRPSSGHIYFTLKDARAQVRCALFKPRSQWLKFRPADGTQVLLAARLTVYEARGDYQLIVESMEEAGEGALLRAFEELKARLAAESLFDPARKRPLPRYLQRLALITSPSGAAVRDVLSILRRRFPLLAVEVLPVPVQGAGAPAQIVEMLRRADASGRYDALLLTRGGGSLEDLQAFNDEALARAIGASRTPVVSAVGHEVDTSIADFVADLRAATPSAAAELLGPDRLELAALLRRRCEQLAQCWRRRHESRLQRSDHLLQRLAQQRPQARLQRGRERLATLQRALQRQAQAALRLRNERLGHLHARLLGRHPRLRLAERAERLATARRRLEALRTRLLQPPRLQVRALGRALHAVSPLATLERGYAILRLPDGRVLRRAADASVGDAVRAHLADGVLALRVEPEPGSDR
jgi:exodeoxyribonuclease VII large subunit